MEGARRTVRQAWREARSHPGITLGAILTLALGIGGSTTMYAMLAGIGLGLGPVDDPDCVGRVFATNPLLGAARDPFSLEEFLEIRSSTTTFQELAGFEGVSALVAEGGETTPIELTRISPAFFRTVGFALAAGRVFREEDCRAGAPHVVIVTERFCRRRLGQPSSALGKRVRLGEEDYSVVGVLPDRLWYPAPGTDLYVPLEWAEPSDAATGNVSVVGRLRAGVTWEQTRSELRTIAARWAERNPARRRGWTIQVVSVAEDAMKRAGFGLFGLLGPAVVVLLIACSNVASLLLARGARRRREFAVRAALGASRFQLVRERLGESAWMAVVAGGLGLCFSVWGVAAVRAWIDHFRTGLADAVVLDLRALAFAAAVTCLTPLLVGLVPALSVTKPDITETLHDSARHRSARKGPYGGRDLLVIVEMALAVGLVGTAGLFGAFVWEMNHIERRFDASRVLAVGLDVSRTGGPAGSKALVEAIRRAVLAVPGVQAVALAEAAAPFDERPALVTFEDCDPGASSPPPAVPVFAVGDGYLRTLGLPLLRGRGIDVGDTAGSPRVALISESLARRCWPSGRDVGRRLRFGPATDPWTTVVGVVPDALSSRALREILGPPPVYLPAEQAGREASTLLVRASGDARSLIPPIRAAVRAVDARQALAGFGALDDHLARLFAEGWLVLGLMDAFGGFALVLVAVGLFGVTSCSVAERTREFGIRTAIGATRGDIFRLVMTRALTVAGIGALAAACVMAVVTRVLWGQLLTLGAHSPLGFATITSLLAVVVVLACLLPARRAMQVDPVVALRTE